jgi:hypothetical protein
MPSTRQCAGTLLAASIQAGGNNVTLRTGSPIDDVSIEALTLVAVQSAAVITTSDARRPGVSTEGDGV